MKNQLLFLGYLHSYHTYIHIPPAVFASTLPTLFEVGYYSGFLKLILDCLFYKEGETLHFQQNALKNTSLIYNF